MKTKRELIKYTRTMLGEPSIQVEVTDDQMSYIIDDAIQKFTEYAYGHLEESVIIELNGAGEYALPELITNVIKLSKGSNNSFNFSGKYGDGMVPDMWSEQYFSTSVGNSGIGNIIENVIPIVNTQAMYSKYFGDDVNCNFNPYKKVLQVLENYTGNALLHYQYEYKAGEFDNIYDHEWIKGYVKARTKEMWGTVTGKYDQALVGGARINYDRLISEAQQEIERLHEELLNKWGDPAPIMIG